MRGFLSGTGRIAVLLAALVASAASAGSQSERQHHEAAPPGGQSGPPKPVEMEKGRAVGLWRSSFGPVKIETEEERDDVLQGVWVYERGGEEIIGYFRGRLDGNVMSFTWEEPADPEPLRGQGFLIFDPGGQNFHGKWWSEDRERGGDWNGWRETPDLGRPAGTAGAAPDADAEAPPGPPPPPKEEERPPPPTSWTSQDYPPSPSHGAPAEGGQQRYPPPPPRPR